MKEIPESLKKLLVMAIPAFIVFWIFKPKSDSSTPSTGGSTNSASGGSGKVEKLVLSDDELKDERVRGAYEALCAYIDAVNNGEKEKTLSSIRDDFAKEMNIVIYTDSTGKLAVKDTEGNDILVNG